MNIRSFLTGKEPVNKAKELILDEHVKCGCQCNHELGSQCSGRFDNVTCERECPSREFGKRKAFCVLRRDAFCDYKTCQCESKTISARGVDFEDPLCKQMAERDLINTKDYSDNRKVQMVAWTLLGSLLTIVIALSVTTHHYWRRLRQAKGSKAGKGKQFTFEVVESSPSH